MLDNIDNITSNLLFVKFWFNSNLFIFSINACLFFSIFLFLFIIFCWEVFKSKEEYPGPGAYDLPLNISVGPKYAIHSKLNLINDKKRNNFPGPAAYKPMYKTESYFYTFGYKYKKENNKRDTTPRPGNYELRTDKDMIIPSYLFGKEKRENQTFKNKRNIPGPWDI